MRQFVIVYMLEPIDVGARFTTWPLHMTLLPWFEAPAVEPVLAGLKEQLTAFRPFEVKIGQREYFGKLPVKMVEKTPQLERLHSSLLELVNKRQWPIMSRHIGSVFRPHVTQKNGRDAEGTLQVDTVYIAEKQSEGYRQIVGKIGLAS